MNVCYWLLVADSCVLLFVVVVSFASWFVVRCLLLFIVVRCLLFVVCCVLYVVCCLSLCVVVGGCSLVHRWLFVVCRCCVFSLLSLFVVCLLLVVVG